MTYVLILRVDSLLPCKQSKSCFTPDMVYIMQLKYQHGIGHSNALRCQHSPGVGMGSEIVTLVLYIMVTLRCCEEFHSGAFYLQDISVPSVVLVLSFFSCLQGTVCIRWSVSLVQFMFFFTAICLTCVFLNMLRI